MTTTRQRKVMATNHGTPYAHPTNKQPHGSELVVPEGAKLKRESGGSNPRYVSEDGQWWVEFGRYGHREWTIGGNACPGEAECDSLREAQEYVADDMIYGDKIPKSRRLFMEHGRAKGLR